MSLKHFDKRYSMLLPHFCSRIKRKKMNYPTNPMIISCLVNATQLCTVQYMKLLSAVFMD